MQGYGLSHSAGAKRPRKYKQQDTRIYAPPSDIHTDIEKGDRNENVDGGSFRGF